MAFRFLGDRGFTGWHMAGVMGLFFGTVIAANGTLAVMASRSWSGLVVENSYVASAAFNETTAARRQGGAEAWQLGTRYRDGRFAVTLADAGGVPIRDASVVVELGRPSHENEDRTLVLRREGAFYLAEAALAPGLWTGEVEARRPDGAQWRAALRFEVEP